MKNHIQFNKSISKILLILPVLALSCTYDFPESEKATSGSTDFSKVISVGNSLTAGFMNGALYSASQGNSFPSIIANQLKLVGGGDFNQPTITAENGCFNPAGGCTQGRLYLKLTRCDPADETKPLSPGPTPKTGDGAASFAFLGDKTSLNNFGVPGVTLGSALSPALSASPYYARIASNAGTSTLIGDASTALANGGTFFTFWLGNNDILGYATAGGTGTYTSTSDFGTRFNVALGAMLAAKTDAEGTVANIPNVTDIPYFSTINPLSFNVPVCSRPALTAGIGQLNAAINGWNAGVNANTNLSAEQKTALLRPVLSTNFETYPLIIGDASLSNAQVPTSGGTFTIPKIRNVVAADKILICLSAGSNPAGLPAGMGVSPANPINEAAHDAFYLTPVEQVEIKSVVEAYNTIISASVNSNSSRLALVDINATMSLIKKGSVVVNGIPLLSSISPPYGAFSLDGVHPNARGSAYIANIFINAINAKWESNIPLVNPNDYSGNELPIP